MPGREQERKEEGGGEQELDGFLPQRLLETLALWPATAPVVVVTPFPLPPALHHHLLRHHPSVLFLPFFEAGEDRREGGRARERFHPLPYKAMVNRGLDAVSSRYVFGPLDPSKIQLEGGREGGREGVYRVLMAAMKDVEGRERKGGWGGGRGGNAIVLPVLASEEGGGEGGREDGEEGKVAQGWLSLPSSRQTKRGKGPILPSLPPSMWHVLQGARQEALLLVEGPLFSFNWWAQPRVQAPVLLLDLNVPPVGREMGSGGGRGGGGREGGCLCGGWRSWAGTSASTRSGPGAWPCSATVSMPSLPPPSPYGSSLPRRTTPLRGDIWMVVGRRKRRGQMKGSVGVLTGCSHGM
ncbi:hypothetical protein Naga_100624g1 [Nannochloropsis gaditana]|uniref:Uncharacterized protein n=1 Tax=Nannochloropsis gaditana TaxID=72520 RepID=W7T349_9STRA|nr:hypothetical protein Naga_100624g1 [Nannochloropsis gaditana]